MCFMLIWSNGNMAMRNLHVHNRIPNIPFLVLLHRRWKSKLRHPFYYQYRRPSEPHEVAKAFFDGVYSKRFGKKWPSMRCALLSRKKYAAILNNFTDNWKTESDFINSGAVDLVAVLRENAENLCKEINHESLQVQSNVHMQSENFCSSISSSSPSIESEKTQSDCEEHGARMAWLEDQYYKYDELKNTCPGLKVYSYPKSSLTEFADPLLQKRSTPNLEYFLLDGSSILPVLALDPKPSDHILDMCSAPGGKLICMAQMTEHGIGSITANDVSKSRLERVRKIQDEYIPEDSEIRKRMKLINHDAREWENIEIATYDKVLVDVPCSADRSSMFPSTETRDNIFTQVRKRERGSLPIVQAEILRNAILACHPGGTIVYSTSTASMQQNEYVVQMTVQHVLQNYGITCEIHDLSPIADLLKDHFNFYDLSKLGILALPSLDSNYGPTYVCKINRNT